MVTCGHDGYRGFYTSRTFGLKAWQGESAEHEGVTYHNRREAAGIVEPPMSGHLAETFP